MEGYNSGELILALIFVVSVLQLRVLHGISGKLEKIEENTSAH